MPSCGGRDRDAMWDDGLSGGLLLCVAMGGDVSHCSMLMAWQEGSIAIDLSYKIAFPAFTSQNNLWFTPALETLIIE